MTDFDLGDPAPDADEEPDDESEVTEETTPSDPPEAPSDPEPEPEPEPESEPADETTESDDEQPDPTETGPAFPYSEVRQNPLYARNETWTEFEDKLDMELTPDLRKEGIRDDELREIHDIVLEVAIDHLDEFPERLKEKRRELR